MSTDYRALCAELHTAVQLYTGQNPAAAETPANELVARLMAALAATAAALAQPEPERLPPRVGHILRLAEIIREVDGSHDKGAAALAEAILSHPGSRWSPTTEPVPVSEQLPGPEDCCGNPRNGRGRWCWGRVLPQTDAGTPVVWRLMLVECLIDEATHWLPHHALPVPGAEVAPADRGSESSLAEFNDGEMPLG